MIQEQWILLLLLLLLLDARSRRLVWLHDLISLSCWPHWPKTCLKRIPWYTWCRYFLSICRDIQAVFCIDPFRIAVPFGGQMVRNWLICPQNGAAVPRGLIHTRYQVSNIQTIDVYQVLLGLFDNLAAFSGPPKGSKLFHVCGMHGMIPGILCQVPVCTELFLKRVWV